jgi:phage gpG-like protein
MNPGDDIYKHIREGMHKLRTNLPRIVGKTAVDHFKENFEKEGFVDNGLQKWPDVKRRDPKSKWYGFEYTGGRTTYKIKKKGKGEKGYQNAGKNRPNFSRAATQRKILSGNTHELARSLRYIPQGNKVILTSDKPYAQVQNEGGAIRVFGRGNATLPARPFVGQSAELDSKVQKEIENRIGKIFNS